MNQHEFEKSIEDDFSEHRNELSFMSVEPNVGAYDHYIRIQPGRHDEARSMFDALSEKLQFLIKIVSASNVHPFRYQGVVASKFGESDMFWCVGHAADRTYAGYANFYRALKQVATLSEDTWFVVKEMYSANMDEFRFRDGKLYFQRHPLEDDCHEEEGLVALEETRVDPVWSSFVARQLCDRAGWMLKKREPKVDEVAEVELWVTKAEAIASNEPAVIYTRARLQRVQGEFEGSLRSFQAYLELNPKDDDAKFEMGAIALACTQPQIAQEAFEALQKRRFISAVLLSHLTSSRFVLEPSYTSWKEDSELAFGLGIMDLVVSTLQANTTQNAAFGHAWFRIAEFFRLKRWGEEKAASIASAEAAYKRARECDGSSAEILRGHALFFEQTGRPQEQLETLTHASKVAADDHKVWGELGLLAYNKADLPEAARCFRRCFDLVEAQSVQDYQLGARRLAFVHSLCRMARNFLPSGLMQAEALLKEAEAFRDRNSMKFEGVLIGLAELSFDKEDHQAALKYAIKAIELSDSHYGWSHKASALNNLGRTEEALEALDESEQRMTNYWYCHFVRACIFAKTARVDEAIEQLYLAADCSGHELARLVPQEPDFNAIREDPRFIEYSELIRP